MITAVQRTDLLAADVARTGDAGLIFQDEENMPSGSEHLVQFYRDDVFLVDKSSSFIGAGLGAGEGALVIATRDHREALAKNLRAQGVDLAAVQSRGQYVSLDAAEILSKFMVDGSPHGALFMQVVGELLAKAAEGRRGLRAFGEMVALLWADGNGAAAIRVEQLWNELGKTHSFSLFCAYPINGFGDAANGESFLRICGEHSRVIPAESYSNARTDQERSLTIALLQQKAAALEKEITRRKVAEEKLRRREAELTRFVENATIGLHWVGPDGIIQWANQAECEMLGYDPGEYIGHHIAQFHADQQLIGDLLARLNRGECLRDCEARLKCKDGSLKTVLIDSSVLWEEGEFIHTQCFTRDITDQKRDQEAALRLAAIVESSNDAIVSKDLNGIITSWNFGARLLFGYTEEEAIGQPIKMLIPPDRGDEESTILKRIAQGKRIEHYETVRCRKDGTFVNISLTVSPIKDARGHVIGASKIARDITDKIRSKEKLEEMVTERTAQLRDTVTELEAFSYSIAHDMRAPLRSMNSYSRFLEEDFAHALPQKAKDYLRRIASSAGRLDALIVDVLNYSKITRCEMTLEKVDVEKLTRDIIDSYGDLRDANATILVQSPMPPVIGNSAALTQCVSNLLSNAVKFVAPGTPAQVRVRAETKNDCVRLWIEDNGIGISEQGRKRIFHMFQRLNPANEFEGTGIGLTIVRKAVERMGGRVGVESELGAGSRFWIELGRAAP